MFQLCTTRCYVLQCIFTHILRCVWEPIFLMHELYRGDCIKSYYFIKLMKNKNAGKILCVWLYHPEKYTIVDRSEVYNEWLSWQPSAFEVVKFCCLGVQMTTKCHFGYNHHAIYMNIALVKCHITACKEMIIWLSALFAAEMTLGGAPGAMFRPGKRQFGAPARSATKYGFPPTSNWLSRQICQKEAAGRCRRQGRPLWDDPCTHSDNYPPSAWITCRSTSQFASRPPTPAQSRANIADVGARLSRRWFFCSCRIPAGSQCTDTRSDRLARGVGLGAVPVLRILSITGNFPSRLMSTVAWLPPATFYKWSRVIRL